MPSPRRVLVTGLSGFTGRHLQPMLEQRGWQVWGLNAHAPAAGQARQVQADLRDSAALARAVDAVQPTAVIHLAALAFVGQGDADAFYQVNLLGTRHLLQALSELPAPPERVLLASSANVYGNQRQGLLDEEAPPQPANDYAVSKLAMEHMAHLWRDRLPLTIVRPFNYTGVGQSEQFLVPKIVAHHHRHASAIRLGNLDVSRDFSDVRAVARAYCALLEAPGAVGATVNVCSGASHSLRDILALAQAITGHELQVHVDPALVRANEVRTLAGDPGRLRALIGADWAGPPLEQTLRWMLQEPEPSGAPA